MKKSLHLIVAMTLAFCAMETKAQLAPGSIAPDWTFTDLNGTSWHLYAELDSGKTVYIDVSATWCNPCWQYHTSGALEGLYNQYGPAGTNEVRVFFIEGDGSTTDGCMINSGCTDPNHSNTSQGNWVSGTPYPMINPPSAATTTFDNNYSIAYFPTVYMICPNRVITEVGQLTTAGLYAAKANCPAPASQANDPALLSYTGTKVTCSSATISVQLQNNGTSPLTACTITAMNGANQVAQINWTGNLATYATQNVTVGTTNVTATANLTISITSADNNAANNTLSQTIVYKLPTSLPITEGFEASTNFPIVWDENNVNGDAVLWTVVNTAGGFGNSTNSANIDFYNSPSGNIDNLNTTRYDFQFATAPIKMTFDVAYAQYQTETDKLDVNVSTNCGTTWTNKYSKSGTSLMTAPATTSLFVPTAAQWRKDTVDLSSFAGQSGVMIQFKATSNYGNDLYLDNVNITSANSAVTENTTGINNMSVYPNPFNDNAVVNFEMKDAQHVTLNIYDMLSRKIYSEYEGVLNAGLHTVRLNNKNLEPGIYFLTLATDMGTSTQKIVVSK